VVQKDSPLLILEYSVKNEAILTILLAYRILRKFNTRWFIRLSTSCKSHCKSPYWTK